MCLKYNRLKSLLHNPFLRRTKRGAEVIIVDEAKVPEQKYVVKIERKKERKKERDPFYLSSISEETIPTELHSTHIDGRFLRKEWEE